MPEPNLVPHGLRTAESDNDVNCGNCLHFTDERELASYGKCQAFSALVKPEWVCNSYSRPDALTR